MHDVFILDGYKRYKYMLDQYYSIHIPMLYNFIKVKLQNQTSQDYTVMKLNKKFCNANNFDNIKIYRYGK